LPQQRVLSPLDQTYTLINPTMKEKQKKIVLYNPRQNKIVDQNTESRMKLVAGEADSYM
jgi:hypothetical protein